ncbi:MAG: hypothetical protein ACREQA_22580, partial [Candidatus Binatia bacterium]
MKTEAKMKATTGGLVSLPGMVEIPRLQAKKGVVTPAEAGVERWGRSWIPVFTGMTRKTKSRVHIQSRRRLEADSSRTPCLAGEDASALRLGLSLAAFLWFGLSWMGEAMA